MSGKWYIEQSREPGDRGGPYYHETQSVELMESQGLRFSFDDPSFKKKETTLKKKNFKEDFQLLKCSTFLAET